MRKFYHSYCSRPAQELNRWGIPKQLEMDLWCAALSVELMHKHNRQIDLICDSFAAKYFSVIPYGRIFTDIDDLKVVKSFWAASKIFVQDIIKTGDVHIDMDVFFLSDKCLNMLDEYQWDVVAQELEITAFDYEHEGNWYKRHFDFLTANGIEIKSNPYSVNCGVIGFNNEKIKKQYIKEYFDLVDKISKLDATKYEGGTEYFSPDLVCEQMNLVNIIDQHNGKVLFLRPNNEYVYDFREDYLHLIGQTKYSEKNQDWIKSELQKLNPYLFDKLSELLK